MAAKREILIFFFVQTLMDGSYYFPHHNHILHHYHGDFMMTKSWQTNRQHAELKDIACVTLLAGASALCCSSLIVVGARKEREERAESSWISAPDDRSSLHLRATRGIRLGKCEHSSHKRYRQAGWLLMSRSYLAGNLERGQRLYASMWQCVKAGCRNANKAILQLLGTFTQIRCA